MACPFLLFGGRGHEADPLVAAIAAHLAGAESVPAPVPAVHFARGVSGSSSSYGFSEPVRPRHRERERHHSFGESSRPVPFALESRSKSRRSAPYESAVHRSRSGAPEAEHGRCRSRRRRRRSHSGGGGGNACPAGAESERDGRRDPATPAGAGSVESMRGREGGGGRRLLTEKGGGKGTGRADEALVPSVPVSARTARTSCVSLSIMSVSFILCRVVSCRPTAASLPPPLSLWGLSLSLSPSLVIPHLSNSIRPFPPPWVVLIA